jgi:Transposase DDE domain
VRRSEEAGIITHIPANRVINSQGDGNHFDRSVFAYDEAADTLRCPADQTLVRKYSTRRDRTVAYAASASACGAYALKRQCTKAPQRFVTRHWDEEVLQRMNARATLEAMTLRKQTVERVFAELEERHFGRRFLLRGKNRCRHGDGAGDHSVQSEALTRPAGRGQLDRQAASSLNQLNSKNSAPDGARFNAGVHVLTQARRAGLSLARRRPATVG